MNEKESLKFIKKVFKSIERSKSIDDLNNILNFPEIPKKNIIKTDSYPKIEFSITENEIQQLIDNGFLDDELNFHKDITKKIENSLTKLFYATAWKNGDLKKMRHIIRGIMDAEKDKDEQDNALVFYQFGKYLTKTKGQPIIDQHVIRAFALYKEKEIDFNIEQIRKIESLEKKHKSIIKAFKKWLTSENLTKELMKIKDYTYYIDKVLFAVGKTIKLKKNYV